MSQQPIFQPEHPVRKAVESKGVRFVRFLGRGGFNEAWEVERDQARQCLKLSTVPLDDVGFELEALAAYDNPQIQQHPFIVGYYGRQTAVGHLATYWELGSRTLLDVLEEAHTRDGRQGLDWQQVVGDPLSRGGYLWSVAEALDDFNQLGHLHRDLKPANLFVFFRNHVKLGDLGLAKYVGASTHQSIHRVGTLGYQPPEALRGQWSQTSDRYSFAATYIKLRTNLEPFGDESPADVYERQRLGAPVLKGLEPFERVPLLQALAHRPADRPKDGAMGLMRSLQPTRDHRLAPSLPFVEPQAVTIAQVEVPPVAVEVQAIPIAFQAAPGLPEIPADIRQLTSEALGCDQAIAQLRDGSHTALRPGLAAVERADKQEREMLADLQAHKPNLPDAIKKKIADDIQANPAAPIVPLLKKAPQADPDELLGYLHRVRNVCLATRAKQAAQAAFERAKQQEIEKLSTRRQRQGDKLSDWQRQDLEKIVEQLRKNAAGDPHFPLAAWLAIQPALLARYGKSKSDTLALLERAERCYRYGNLQRHTNSLDMEFLEIVEGEYLMGSPDGVGSDDERPQHRVVITRPILVAKYPVTVGQWRKFVKASGYTACGDDWKSPGFQQADNHPVVHVSHDDAVAMAAWLTKTDRENHSLLTEAEWEYACRAGTTTLHYAGDDLEWLKKNANCAQMHGGTTPVDRYPPNPWGLHDMLGNCWEWVADWYDGKYDGTASANDPTGPAQESYRVLRGGSWWNPESGCRSGCRFFRVASHRYDDVGFRLCIRRD